jgi:uncharacterized protein YggE
MRAALITAGLAIAGLAAAPAAHAAQAQEPHTVTVHATATTEHEPDRARVRFAVVSEGRTAEAASQSNANLMARVIAALRSHGLEGPAIRTTSIQLNPTYATTANQERRISGYSARNMVEVTIDSLAIVGPVTDAVIAAGANSVAGLSFELRHPEAARREALAAAMDMARAEASVVAAAADRVLGPPLRIEVQPGSGGPIIRGYSMNRAEAMAVETPVEAGTIEVSATVVVVYRMDLR